MQARDIPLHDIKPLIEIQEYSMYYLIALGVVALVLFIALAYLAFHYIRNKNKFNIRKEHIKMLGKIAFNDSKKDAYEITLYGATFMHDSERHMKAYELLVEHLESYKYRKDVDSFDEETKREFDNFIGMLDV